MSTHEEQLVEDGHLVEWRPGELSRLVPPVWWEPDEESRRRGEFRGWQRPVSDAALRIWARRVGVEPDAAIRWKRERFPDGKRWGPPPGLVYADAEASARGVYVTPRERRSREAARRGD
jgi:hypothetical protein